MLVNLILPLNVETPVTFNCCASKSVVDVIPRVDIPDTVKDSASTLDPCVPIPVKFSPLPKYDVAVTELIPDIFVELSPTILPFALILPETVAELKVPSDVIFG